MKINWKCEIPFENKELDKYDSERLSRIVQTYIRILTIESDKLKKAKAEILAKKPFAEFSIANPSGWSYISAISPYCRDKYNALLKTHFIAELANKAEKEINNGAGVEDAIEIALNQLKNGKEYYMSEADIKSARKTLDSVWKYGKNTINNEEDYLVKHFNP